MRDVKWWMEIRFEGAMLLEGSVRMELSGSDCFLPQGRKGRGGTRRDCWQVVKWRRVA